VQYNVLNDDLDVESEAQHPGYTVGGTVVGKRVGSEELGVTLYVLPPDNAQAPYHWHHNVEELLLVLSGEPTVRTPEGERQLQPGDLVPFPCGAGGAHKIMNVSQDTARYLIFSTKPTIDIVEYPDSHKVGFGSRGRGSRMVREGESLDYWDGE